MVETDVHSCLILDMRKKTNGCNIYLDQTKLAHFVGQVDEFPIKAMGLLARLKWIWGA
jgi:hypothetical protein